MNKNFYPEVMLTGMLKTYLHLIKCLKFKSNSHTYICWIFVCVIKKSLEFLFFFYEFTTNHVDNIYNS